MKALVICRDNIGDTLLTTPLISALAREGGYRVDVLANSYNADALARNPDIGRIFIYKKLHHRREGESRLRVLLQRLGTMWQIRRAGYRIAVLAKSQWDPRVLKWATLARAERVIALGDRGHREITDLVTPPAGSHEHLVRRFQRMLAPLGLASSPGPLVLQADQAESAALGRRYGLDGSLPTIGLQISARRVLQRWSEQNFIALIQLLAAGGPCQIILLWSPGAADNAAHPGDDAMAARIQAACGQLGLTAIATQSLDALISAMQLCDSLVTSDGGAMHIAAGLGKKIVALFGDSDPVCWAPWQVPHVLLRGEAQNVASLTPEQVYQALCRLNAGAGDE